MGDFKSILQKKLRSGKTQGKKVQKTSVEDGLRECTELKLNLDQAKDSGKWYQRRECKQWFVRYYIMI